MPSAVKPMCQGGNRCRIDAIDGVYAHGRRGIGSCRPLCMSHISSSPTQRSAVEQTAELTERICPVVDWSPLWLIYRRELRDTSHANGMTQPGRIGSCYAVAQSLS